MPGCADERPSRSGRYRRSGLPAAARGGSEVGRLSRVMSPRFLSVLLLPMLVVGCGGGGDKTSSNAPAPKSSSTVTQNPPAAAEPKTGAEVVAVLKAAGLPLTLTVDYDENTDKNKLLGRPNGYLDKIAFADSRIKKADVFDDDLGSVELGGSVEVFENHERAQARADYITSVTKDTPALVEYDYVEGAVLLRLSKNFTPTQAKAYADAL